MYDVVVSGTRRLGSAQPQADVRAPRSVKARLRSSHITLVRARGGSGYGEHYDACSFQGCYTSMKCTWGRYNFWAGLLDNWTGSSEVPAELHCHICSISRTVTRCVGTVSPKSYVLCPPRFLNGDPQTLILLQDSHVTIISTRLNYQHLSSKW